jgi:hypothetical protein
MPQAIGHFALGVFGGLVLLMLFPNLIQDITKNDIFFVFASGLFAILPDYIRLEGSNAAHPIWSNLFWFHGIVDNIWTTHAQELQMSVMFLALDIVALYVYYKRLK